MRHRREFLGAASGAGLLLVKPETAFGYQANSAPAVGIIGCGGRGNFIGQFFREYAGSRIAALSDPFSDRLDNLAKQLYSEQAARYPGLDGYKKLLETPGLDAVAVMSPPYFHPEQVSAALNAGKHVFLAKPLAVDVPGCKAILAASAKAKGKLSFLVDFQTRVQPVFQEAAAKVHAGEIGPPVMGHVYYHAGRLRPQDKPGMPAGEARLRNWVFDKVLSGDIIVEQNIHVIDTANWYLKGHPVKAVGTGGRKARVDVGDCWDHFVVTYTYPNDVRVDFSSAQFTRGYNDLCIRIYGAAGTLDSHYGGAVNITGDKPWKGTASDDTFRQGAITNVKAFVESIRTGNLINNVAESVESNLTAILGRMAAYRERTVTWEEMMRSNDALEANLKL